MREKDGTVRYFAAIYPVNLACQVADCTNYAPHNSRANDHPCLAIVDRGAQPGDLIVLFKGCCESDGPFSVVRKVGEAFIYIGCCYLAQIPDEKGAVGRTYDLFEETMMLR